MDFVIFYLAALFIINIDRKR